MIYSLKYHFWFFFLVVQNDHPAPTVHDTPKAYGLSQTEAAMFPQNNSKVRDPGFHFVFLQNEFLAVKNVNSISQKTKLFENKSILLYSEFKFAVSEGLMNLIQRLRIYLFSRLALI